jgi:hypothetical protein
LSPSGGPKGAQRRAGEISPVRDTHQPSDSITILDDRSRYSSPEPFDLFQVAAQTVVTDRSSNLHRPMRTLRRRDWASRRPRPGTWRSQRESTFHRSRCFSGPLLRGRCTAPSSPSARRSEPKPRSWATPTASHCSASSHHRDSAGRVPQKGHRVRRRRALTASSPSACGCR